MAGADQRHRDYDELSGRDGPKLLAKLGSEPIPELATSSGRGYGYGSVEIQ